MRFIRASHSSRFEGALGVGSAAGAETVCGAGGEGPAAIGVGTDGGESVPADVEDEGPSFDSGGERSHPIATKTAAAPNASRTRFLIVTRYGVIGVPPFLRSMWFE